LVKFFVDYNHRRAHLGIGSLVPADRFYGRWPEVIAEMDAVSRRRQGVFALQLDRRLFVEPPAAGERVVALQQRPARNAGPPSAASAATRGRRAVTAPPRHSTPPNSRPIPLRRPEMFRRSSERHIESRVATSIEHRAKRCEVRCEGRLATEQFAERAQVRTYLRR